MVDEEALADLRARVDIDPRRRVGRFGDDPGQHRHAQAMQAMGQSVADDRRDAGIAADHFVSAARRGISLVGRADIAFEQGADAGQIMGELQGDVVGRAGDVRGAGLGDGGGEEEFAPGLVFERRQGGAQRCGHEAVHVARRQTRRAEVPGEKSGGQALDDLDRRRARGKVWQGAVLIAAPVGPCSQLAQCVDHAPQARILDPGKRFVGPR